MKFNELGLLPELLRAVEEAGYTTPTPIQEQAIPVALRGRDVLGCAQTGTGKTAGFLLPLLQRLATSGPKGPLNPSPSPSPQVPVRRTGHAGGSHAVRRVRALILTPTRELAAQVGESALTYGKYLSLRVATVFGGVGMTPQTDLLRRGVDVLVATPGRLLDHMGRKHVSFDAVEVLVLDEADRMLDMGFLPDVERILKTLPPERQNLLFSATMPPEIEALVGRTLRAPVVVEVVRRATTVKLVRQVVHPVSGEKKRDLLCHLLGAGDMRHVLVFTRTKSRADRLARHLERTDRRVATIHGDKSQGARTKALEGFRSGRIDLLVATDIAARGIDVEGISHVVNFDVPLVAEDYVHRIGRTARAEATGSAISLVSAEETGYMGAIEKLIGMRIPRENVGEFSAGAHVPSPVAPASRPHGGGHGGGAHRGAAPHRGSTSYRGSASPSRGAESSRGSSSYRGSTPSYRDGGSHPQAHASQRAHASRSGRPAYGRSGR